VSRLNDLLGLTKPIFQAPIGSFTNPDFVAAVANTGCAGMHALSWTATEEIAEIISETQNKTTGAFGANLVLQWDQHERFDALVASECRLISFFWGDPSPYLKKAKSSGIKTMLTVGSSEEARHAAEIGIDILVAQGVESGGHVWGDITTMALVPAISKAVPEVPVVAAGGIASGRAIAAALALGAEAVWMGTRFVASAEATAHPGYKDLIAESSESATVHCCTFDGGWPDAPHRVLRTRTVDAGEQDAEKDRARIGQLPSGEEVFRFDDIPPAAGMSGAWEEMALYAGQSVGQIESVEPIASIIEDLMAEARSAASGLRGKFD
jgi:NAD(P)H-dependent flavin oxidoreductase YrpB (nitropropane dioxygenase family)